MKNTTLIIISILILVSCAVQKNELSSENLAKNACECFEKQKGGSIDDKLTPCLSNPINENQHEIHDIFHSDLSLEAAIKKHMMETSINMVHTCDKYYYELDMMFTSMYPETNFEQVKEEIDALTDSIASISEMDSIKLGLIHQKISLLTKSRKLDEALNEIDFLSRNYSPAETYFIKMYIYRLQEKYDESLEEIEKAVKEGNNDYVFYTELIKRKKNDR